MKTLIEDPFEMTGGCDINLYCRYENTDHGRRDFPAVYYHPTRLSRCRKDARADGWVIHSDNTATCPKCSGKKPTAE